MTCADGYSIGGGTIKTLSQEYTCTENGPVASIWLPDPAVTRCLRELSLGMVVVVVLAWRIAWLHFLCRK